MALNIMTPTRSFTRLTASDGRSIEGKNGAGVLLLCPSTGRFLVGKRGSKGSFPNTWAPFGGMVEDGEHIPVAAVRELGEEAGVIISVDSFTSPIPVYVDEIPQVNFSFYTYCAAVPNEFPGQIRLNHESSGYQWATHAELTSLPNCHPGFRRLLRSAGYASLLSLLPPTHR